MFLESSLGQCQCLHKDHYSLLPSPHPLSVHDHLLSQSTVPPMKLTDRRKISFSLSVSWNVCVCPSYTKFRFKNEMSVLSYQIFNTTKGKRKQALHITFALKFT
jgi:hypothetical protein